MYVYTRYIVLGRIADPGGFYPDPTFEESRIEPSNFYLIIFDFDFFLTT